MWKKRKSPAKRRTKFSRWSPLFWESEEAEGKLTPVRKEHTLHSIHSWSLQREPYLLLPSCSKGLNPWAVQSVQEEGKEVGTANSSRTNPTFQQCLLHSVELEGKVRMNQLPYQWHKLI